MKAISFLGFNPKGYIETTYLNPLNGAGVSTKFFQEALVEFYKPQKLYVLLTKTAETRIPEGASESTWESLRKRLESRVDLYPVTDVPEGHQQADVRTIFNKLTGCLQNDDCVLFDITHGFRSLPVLALIAVSYLRVARNISLEGLIYGAFDARDLAKNETPIYDLKPIIELLNWTTATDQFLKTGNAKSLADLLQPQAQLLAESISSISQGLHLLRPHEVMKAATDLSREIKNVKAQVETKIPPFALLMQRIEQSYGKFGMKKISDDRERLIHQLEIAER
jgi:CRISPR-associated DxTHG motif protein